MKVFIKFSIVLLAIVLLSSSFAFSQTQTAISWKPQRATLLAKSTVLMVEYAPDGAKKGYQRKYKLFDIALGKVLLELDGRDYYGRGSRMVVIDNTHIAIYDVNATTPVQVAKFKASELSNAAIDNFEIIGLSSIGNPIFRQTGAESASYYLYNIATRGVRKLGHPEELYKSTFVAQTGLFDYMKESKTKHLCYSYNPETDLVAQTGTLDSVSSKNIYRIQLSKGGSFAIYGCCLVYDMKNGKVMYSLPVSNEDMDWTGNKMSYSGTRVLSGFSAKGDSVIVIKKMKENMQADEKVQVEIYSTINDAPVKSFFIFHKGDVLVDADIPSGWAAFMGNGKVKVVHLTTRTTVREFSLLTPDIAPASGALPVKNTSTSAN